MTERSPSVGCDCHEGECKKATRSPDGLIATTTVEVKVRNVVQLILLFLVVLALFAVFTLSTFRPLGGGKVDDAYEKAEQLRIYEKAYSARNDGKYLEDLSDLASFAEDGSRAILDPWGKQFQFRYGINPKTGREQFVVWTVSPDGKVLAAPREAAEWIGLRDAPR